MTDLLLHVGLHKSGTTTAQDVFHNNAEKLIKHHILYPKAGLIGTQHALIPGCLINSHPFLDHENRIRDLDHYLHLLRAELDQSQPKLAIISSEVFTEISHDRDSCLELISRLAALFKDTSILVTYRDEKELALSSLKHMTREGFPGCTVSPIDIYYNMRTHFKNNREFWQQSGMPLIEKNLNESTGDLVDFYFSDILGRYGDIPRDLLRIPGQTGDPTGSRSNADIHSSLVYLILLMVGNSTQATMATDQHLFKLIIEECEKSLPVKEQKSILTSTQLINYLEYFSDRLHLENRPNTYISITTKLNALAHTGIPPRSTGLICSIISRIHARLLANPAQPSQGM
jgi:hypothetical protein